MGSDPPPETVAEAARAIDHPVRVRIVRELTGRDRSTGTTRTFSSLRDAVGLRDNGRFDYHLDRLRDGLVETAADGYRLSPAGRELANLLATGHVAEPDRRREFPTETACHTCGGPLSLACRPRSLALRCRDCRWEREWSIRLPRSAFEGEPDDARTVVDLALRNGLRALARTCCPDCLGAVETDLTATARSEGDALDIGVEHDCQYCGTVLTTTVGQHALAHDATAGFFADNGVSLTDRPVWDLEFAVTDHRTHVRSRRPWRVEVRPRVGNRELVLVVDEDASVRAVDRHTKIAADSGRFPTLARG